jgi:hypothetical protein
MDVGVIYYNDSFYSVKDIEKLTLIQGIENFQHKEGTTKIKEIHLAELLLINHN